MRIYSQYNLVYDNMLQFQKNIAKINEELQSAVASYQSGIGDANTQAQNEIQKINACQNKINAFISIAKTHTTDLRGARTAQKVDIQRLSMLSVQINNASRNDSYATMLYTEATGQLLMLNQALNQANSALREQKSKITQRYQQEQSRLTAQKNKAFQEFTTYLRSNDFTALINQLHNNRIVFTRFVEGPASLESYDNCLCPGEMICRFPTPVEGAQLLENASQKFYRGSQCTMNVPFYMNFLSGGVSYIEYVENKEDTLLNGIRAMIINIALYYYQQYKHIVYVDPIRYNASALGCLEELSIGQDAYMDHVPASAKEIEDSVNRIILTMGQMGDIQSPTPAGSNLSEKVYIFHDFPNGYSSSVVDKIRQLCVNAKHYGISVILTHPKDIKDSDRNDIVEKFKSLAVNTILHNGQGYYALNGKNAIPFEWYIGPDSLPHDIKKRYILERPKVNMSNDYVQRIGIGNQEIKKGCRRLEEIPVGIDQRGKIVTIDMEDENFAVFLCGASRSGKSTLLHSLITSVLQKMHPDDVEIWLVDFKLMEFSRYIDHLPPHVRYLLLDESPELSYDIIDRLSEILQKRQHVFMGKWENLSKVPVDKYMPAIFVIIDEFSIMSEIIAERADYRAKLQALLAKGAAAGMHFIFSSQGFTDGTKALTSFSKRQIQQRIAMKAGFDEIKATLDLKTISEDDHRRMAELKPWYSLIRVPEDSEGNHLRQNFVLYISDYKVQEKYIDEMAKKYRPMSDFMPEDEKAYIDKKPLIINGNQYSTMSAVEEEIKKEIDRHRNSYEDSTLVFLGEPRRMAKIWPISISDSFCENVLLIAPVNERDPMISAMISLHESLKRQGKTVEYWSSPKDATLSKMNHIYLDDATERHQDVVEICDRIREIKETIKQQNKVQRYIAILGLPSLLVEMEYLVNEKIINTPIEDSSPQDEIAGDHGKTGPARTTQDMLEQLEAGKIPLEDAQKDTLDFKSSNKRGTSAASGAASNVYDPREDLKYILKSGPRFGCHFVVALNTAAEFGLCKLGQDDFRHKVMFRMAKADALEVTNTTIAAQLENVAERCYRYTNGLDSCTFRPYLYPGLFWDGWEVGSDGNVQIRKVKEEYLM